MAKNIIDVRIKEASKRIKNGEDASLIQEELRDTVDRYASNLGCSEDDIKAYGIKIDSLGEDINTKGKINLKKPLAIAAISATLVATAIGGTAVYRNLSDSNIEKDIDEEDFDKEEQVSSVSGTAINQNTDSVLPSYLTFNVNDLGIVRANMASFLNDSLTKGLGTKGTTEPKKGWTNENKDKKIEAFYNMYLAANINNLDYKTFAKLDKDGNLNADDIYQDYIEAFNLIQDDAFTSKNNTILDLAPIISDKNNLSYVEKLQKLIANINETKDKDKLNNYYKEARKIKTAMLTNSASNGTEYDASSLDMGLTLLEVIDNLSNGVIITNDEDEKQIYNSFYKECVTIDEKKAYKKAENKEIKASEQSLKSVVRFKILYRIEAALKAAREYEQTPNINFTTEDSFAFQIAEISKNVDLDNQKVNPYTASKWYMKKVAKISTKELKETKTWTKKIPSRVVSSKDVPSDKKKKKKVVSKTVDGKKTTDTWLKAKTKGLEEGNAEFIKEYKSTGNQASLTPKMSIPSNPGRKSTNYAKIKAYYKAVSYMQSRARTIAKENSAKKSNDKAKENTKYEPVTSPIPVGEPTYGKEEDVKDDNSNSNPSGNDSSNNNSSSDDISYGDEELLNSVNSKLNSKEESRATKYQQAISQAYNEYLNELNKENSKTR